MDEKKINEIKIGKIIEHIKNNKYDVAIQNLEELIGEINSKNILYEKNKIENELSEIENYCFSISRNTEKEWWEIEVGLPLSWEVKRNNNIGFTVLNENEMGKVLHIFPNKDNVTIDDLILFVKIIIKTNEEIAEKEKQFNDEIEKMKKDLEDKIKGFYENLEKDKEKAFKSLDVNLKEGFNKTENDEEKEKKQ